jgi:hypothetical protein
MAALDRLINHENNDWIDVTGNQRQSEHETIARRWDVNSTSS